MANRKCILCGSLLHKIVYEADQKQKVAPHHHFYLITENSCGKRYIGFTQDLKQRIKQHNNASGCKTTKFGLWQLVYYEAYLNKHDATKREYKLKHDGRSRRFLYERVAKSLAEQK